MAIKESGEMYLETILVLSKEKSHVRSIDVAEHMNYSKPSVSRAMGLLRDGNYIQIDRNGFITLTDSGRAVAERIYERHTFLTELFVGLGVDREIAAEDACKIEHYLSDATFEAVKRSVSEAAKKRES